MRIETKPGEIIIHGHPAIYELVRKYKVDKRKLTPYLERTKHLTLAMSVQVLENIVVLKQPSKYNVLLYFGALTAYSNQYEDAGVKVTWKIEGSDASGELR